MPSDPPQPSSHRSRRSSVGGLADRRPIAAARLRETCSTHRHYDRPSTLVRTGRNRAPTALPELRAPCANTPTIPNGAPADSWRRRPTREPTWCPPRPPGGGPVAAAGVPKVARPLRDVKSRTPDRESVQDDARCISYYHTQDLTGGGGGPRMDAPMGRLATHRTATDRATPDRAGRDRAGQDRTNPDRAGRYRAAPGGAPRSGRAS